MSAAGKRERDAAKLSSLGCQKNDGEAKQAFVRRCGGDGMCGCWGVVGR